MIESLLSDSSRPDESIRQGLILKEKFYHFKNNSLKQFYPSLLPSLQKIWDSLKNSKCRNSVLLLDMTVLDPTRFIPHKEDDTIGDQKCLAVWRNFLIIEKLWKHVRRILGKDFRYNFIMKECRDGSSGGEKVFWEFESAPPSAGRTPELLSFIHYFPINYGAENLALKSSSAKR